MRYTKRCVKFWRLPGWAPGLTLSLLLVPGFGFGQGIARASDGVLEINQACATGGGCFSGDVGGFPVQITGSAGRSYILTSDLVTTDLNTTLIEFSGTLSGYTLDLAGFSLRGPVSCTGNPVVCSPLGGTGSGISRNTASIASGITVRDGTITGMGRSGIDMLLVNDCVVEGVVARENRFNGVGLGVGSRIDGVQAVRNGATGISTGEDSIVHASVSIENGGVGIGGSAAGSVILRNTVVGNLGFGIFPSGGSASVIANTVSGNGGTGIEPGSGALVMENSIEGNGTAVVGAGVSCGTGCRVHGNSVRANTDTGLAFSLDGAYSDNNITANTVQPVSGTATARGGNLCNGPGTVSATCP